MPLENTLEIPKSCNCWMNLLKAGCFLKAFIIQGVWLTFKELSVDLKSKEKICSGLVDFKR